MICDILKNLKSYIENRVTMATLEKCPLFWTEDPNILLENARDFFPFSEESRLCSTTALNSLTRFGFYIGVVLFILTRNGLYLGIPVFAAVLTVSLYHGMKQQGSLRKGPYDEGFQTSDPSIVINKVLEDIIGIQDRTSPVNTNPYMNFLINEISELPKKPPAQNIDNSQVKSIVETKLNAKLYGDPGDVWNRNQGQLTFYTTPSTSLPNDRDSYQNWLYRVPGKTCKEGNSKACDVATDGSPVVYLSNM